MTPATKTAVAAILKADPTITTEQVQAALEAAAGTTTPNAIQPLARAVRPKDAALALGVSRRTLRRYAVAGLLQPVYRGKGKARRTVAYTAQSVNDFVNGKGAAND